MAAMIAAAAASSEILREKRGMEVQEGAEGRLYVAFFFFFFFLRVAFFPRVDRFFKPTSYG